VITLTVNGDTQRIKAEQSLYEFVSMLGFKPEKVAVERNLEIVPKSTFKEVILCEGDNLEIVHFIGGGSDA
jgi:thiazole synthase